MHQRVVTDIILRLGNFIRAHDLGELFVGPFDVLFAEGDYLEPAILTGADVLRWQPIADGPVLEASVAEMVAE